MTEDEAKKKWCPFARSGTGTGRTLLGDPYDGTRCIASACMVWRWGIHKNDEEPSHGYCGLVNR